MKKKAQHKVFTISGQGIQHAPNHPNVPFYTTEEVLEEKHYFDYLPEVQSIIDLMTIKTGIDPVGSSKFTVHKYPGDIDFLEPVVGCCTLNALRLPMARNIQQIIRRIQATPDVYFSRFQCGYDRRYDIYLGREQKGKLVDYVPQIARREIVNLYEQGLLTEEELERALSLVRSNPSLGEFFQLYWFLRDMVIVDWTQEEILRGYKELRGGKKLYLDDGLIDKSLVKLDVHARIPYPDMKGSRFVEFTNWFLVQVENEEGNVETMSLIQEDRLKSLRSDVRRFATRDPLKAAKRYWNYLFELEKTSEVKAELRRIAPLFSCYPAFLNSVATDLELQKEMLQRGLLTAEEYRLFLRDTRRRMKEYAPVCYFDSKENERLASNLDLREMQRTVRELTENFLRENKINMLSFIETH